jgi:flagellar biosynthesis protein FlhF
MKIKTYLADNIQDALQKIKIDLGKDAIILQTRQVKKGGFLGFFSKPLVEVIAASDVNITREKPKTTANLNKLPLSAPYFPKQKNEEDLEDIKTNLDEVKKLVKDLYVNNPQKNYLQPDLPVAFREVYSKMDYMEVDPSIIKKLILNSKAKLSEEELNDKEMVFNAVKSQILSYLTPPKPIAIPKEKQIIVAFIGPTGVGKTTTIAKLAANFTLYHKKRVAMITADTFRVGAVEQLKLYGKILEIPVMVVNSPEEIRGLLSTLSEYELILVDTMGSSPNNKMQIKRIKRMLEQLVPNEIHMVLSAASKTREIGEILDSYSELNYDKLLFTKLDETKSYGVILNAVNHANCNLSYVTVGQNVPDDIKEASAEEIAEIILGEGTYV